MDQAGSGDEFLELGHKWCMGIVHDWNRINIESG